MIGRIFSILITLVYLITILYYGAASQALLLVAYLLLPLGCIWFSEALGNFTGTLGGNPGTVKSSAFLVRLMGWILLLLPAFIYGLILLSKK